MAAKKKSRKKRTPKQIAATKRLVALNKKKGKKKSSKKKAGKRKVSRKKAPKKVAKKKASKRKASRKTKHIPTLAEIRRAEMYGSSLAEGRPSRSAKKTRKKAGKKTSRKSTPKPQTKTVTAADIMKGSFKGSTPSNVSAIWVCAGPKRTGCGGGKKGRRGSRVVGVMR